jgi:hypothetical protein
MIHARFSGQNPILNMTATAASYTTGKVMGVPTKFANISTEPGALGILESLVLVDKEDVSLGIDIFLFNQLPTSQGADTATFALSAAESVNCLGVVSVASTDYKASSVVGIATKANLQLILSPLQQTKASAGGRDIYAVAVARASITFSNVGSLWLRLGIRQF